MYEHMHFKLCIILFIYFQNVVSFKIYQLDSEEGNEVLPKIRQLILDQRNEELGHLNPKNVKRQHIKPKPFGKSVFVKRIIPHGYDTGKYEYDPKLNTLFKPLNRFHVNRPVKEQEKVILNRFESERNPKGTPEKDLIVLVQKKQDQQELVRQIQKYLDQNVREQNHLKKNKKRFRGLLSRLDKEDLLLLRNLGKSGEQYDPYAPGKPQLAVVAPSSESLETTEKTPVSEYPFWNYWTYSKTLQVDRCPGNLIQMGNMCINSLGHRRSWNAPNIRRNLKSNKKSRSIRAARKKHLYGRKK